MKLQPLIVKPAAFYEVIMHPNFADVSGDFNGFYNGTLSEFTVMDNVSLANGTPIIDIFKQQNFLQRKDRSCKTNWSKVANTSNRKIKISELYGAVEDCQEAFYADCMKDFRDQAPRFRDMVLSIFKGGIGVDMTTNSYFGDVTREDDDTYSLNKFDGIVVKIDQYAADGLIPAGQIITALPSGAITPAQAYASLKEAKDKRSPLMKVLPKLDLAFYVDEEFATAYMRYLISVGVNHGNDSVFLVKNGIPALAFEGIPIYIEPFFNVILAKLNGDTEAHMLILTIRGNFIFGTQKSYGGGANNDQALKVWYSDDDDVWRRKMWLTAGVDIAMPEHIVFGITNIT